MKQIKNISDVIGRNYPTNTGRLKLVLGSIPEPKRIALTGDSTFDNDHWVDPNQPYAEKKHTVTHQTAVALATSENGTSYEIGNFAVDGATTSDLFISCSLARAVHDSAHPIYSSVNQLKAVAAWQPNIVVVSVGGNNYRDALNNVLLKELSVPQLFLRSTPEHAKAKIVTAFKGVKDQLLEDYKRLIDELIANNPKLDRIVLLSQYYPEITEITRYFIYTGFSHISHSDKLKRDSFSMMEDTMNELYRDILRYALHKNKEIVFADVTSSLNPLGGNHTWQIEPNEKGSTIMGRMIAEAVEYSFPKASSKSENFIPILRMSADEKQIEAHNISEGTINNFNVKKIKQFIDENRYRHLGLFFSPPSSLVTRYESAYHAIVGKQFDAEYRGLFAFGLLDLSLITVAASYLWRVAIDEELHLSLRVIAGTIAAPILLAKMVVGLATLAVLALPIYAYHKAVHHPLEIPQSSQQIMKEEAHNPNENEKIITEMLYA